MKYNYGTFEGQIYLKEVNFSKAVLWMTRELSLRENIVAKCAYKNIEIVRFVDRKKGEVWDFDAKRIIKEARKKQVGQEQQYYFPIGWAKRKIIKEGQSLNKEEARII